MSHHIATAEYKIYQARIQRSREAFTALIETGSGSDSSTPSPTTPNNPIVQALELDSPALQLHNWINSLVRREGEGGGDGEGEGWKEMGEMRSIDEEEARVRKEWVERHQYDGKKRDMVKGCLRV